MSVLEKIKDIENEVNLRSKTPYRLQTLCLVANSIVESNVSPLIVQHSNDSLILDGPNAKEQGHGAPLGSAQGQAGKAAA